MPDLNSTATKLLIRDFGQDTANKLIPVFSRSPTLVGLLNTFVGESGNPQIVMGKAGGGTSTSGNTITISPNWIPGSGQLQPTIRSNDVGRRALLVAGFSTLSGCMPTRPVLRRPVAAEPGGAPVIDLEEFAPSPDGRVVAFQFSHGDHTPKGLGLYNWRTRALTRVPNPPGKQLSMPSFAPDGKTLAVVLIAPTENKTFRCIATIDLASMACIEISSWVPSLGSVSYPVFQPDSTHILYAEEQDMRPVGLKLVRIADRTEETVLAPADGFLLVSRMSFVSNNEIYFTANIPHLTALRAEIAKDNLIGADTNYRLKFGGMPERLNPGLDAPRKGRVGAAYTFVSSSMGGKVVVARGLNLEAPTRPHGAFPAFNYDIFQMDGDAPPRQLTNARSYLSAPAISADGTTVCFGSTDDRDAPTELNILDVRSGNVLRTDLLRQVATKAEFAS